MVDGRVSICLTYTRLFEKIVAKDKSVKFGRKKE